MENTNSENKMENQTNTVSSVVKNRNALGRFMVPVIVIAILAVFIGIIYWAKIVKPKSEIDEKLGFQTEDYVELGKYKGLSYDLTQEEWDESVGEETNTYEQVNRPIIDTDQVDYNYTAYVDGKKDDNISAKDESINIGEDRKGIYKKFSDAMKGHKENDTITVKGCDATELSSDGTSYKDKNVTFELKIVTINQLCADKVTDEWVNDNYFEDMGLSTKDDFYNWIKEYLVEESIKPKLWEEVVKNSKMNGYPADYYNHVVEEVNGNMEAEAKEQEISLEDYKELFGYTDEALEEEYLYNVKSELIMWQLVKDLQLEVTEEEIEQKYEDEYLEVNLESAEEMKELYTKDEMREAILLEKVQNYIYEKAKITFSYKIK